MSLDKVIICYSLLRLTKCKMFHLSYLINSETKGEAAETIILTPILIHNISEMCDNSMEELLHQERDRKTMQIENVTTMRRPWLSKRLSVRLRMSELSLHASASV